MTSFLPAELIKKKRRGESHSAEELDFLIQKFTSGELPDYQMAAWLMAAWIRGLNATETSLLTDCMRRSGRVLDFSHLGRFVIDKHSTGGVGDKTSLILAPLVACAELTVPMMSGRGLGHTGGTLDKLEAIPGMNVRLPLADFERQIAKLGVAMVGQTKEICPADLKLYALRDVTGTVESIPLICASIMSKKLAEGLNGLVLDVKFGRGAFMKTLPEAEKLAQNLCQIGWDSRVDVRALLTNMNQPLGSHIGSALEVQECLNLFRGEESDLEKDTKELTIELAAHMFHVSKIDSSVNAGRLRAEKYLTSGQALEKFLELCAAQGANPNWILPKARHRIEVVAPRSGFVQGFDSEGLGLLAIEIGAGRKRIEDKIDPTAGFVLHAKIGSKVEKGQPLLRMEGANETLLLQHNMKVQHLIEIGDETPLVEPLINKVIQQPPERFAHD